MKNDIEKLNFWLIVEKQLPYVWKSIPMLSISGKANACNQHVNCLCFAVHAMKQQKMINSEQLLYFEEVIRDETKKRNKLPKSFFWIEDIYEPRQEFVQEQIIKLLRS